MPTPTPWSPVLTANYRVADSQKDVRFVQLRDGSFWMVWTDLKDEGVGSPTGSDLVGLRYNAFGVAMGGEVRLNTSLFLSDERDAHLAANVDSNGFVIVFEDLNGTGDVNIVLERKNADGTPLGFVTIANDPTNDGTGIDYRNPRVAIASATNGIVVFERTDDAGDTDIVGQLFNPATGALIGGHFDIVNDPNDVFDPQMTVTSDGRYAVVAVDESPTNPANTSLTLAFITTAGAVDAGPISGGFNGRDPSIAALAGGQIILSWTSASGTIETGAYSSNRSVLNVVQAAAQGQDSRVVATGGNNFVIAWEDPTATSINMAAFTLNVTTIATSGGPRFVADAMSTSDLALTALADGRVLIGYDAPLATAQIFDPRANANATAVYAPTDQQIGTPGNDTFTAAANADIVHGWDGNDTITDGAGTEAQYFGGEGDDVIKFSFVDAAEFADGGNGVDVLLYTALAGPTTANLAAGTVTTGAVTQNVINFEHFYSADIDESINVTGGAGYNFLWTGDNVDRLDGGAGADLMRGGGGNDVYIVDDVGDVVGEFTAGGTDEVRTALGNRADPSPIIYVLPFHAENLTGTLGSAQSLQGNGFNNVITTTAGADFLYAQDGGNDTLNSGSGNDFLYFGAAFDNNDTVNGGNGIDRLALYGNYTLTFGAGALTGIERLMLYSEAGVVTNYNLTTIDANVAAGAELEVAALSLEMEDGLTFNGSAETNGSFWIRSGGGNDVLTGGAMADRIVGGLGGDRMTGNGGNDRFDVTAVSHSTSFNFDTLVGFDASADRINISGTVASFTVGQSGDLSNAGFDAALASLVDAALGIGGATKVTATGGGYAGLIFVVVDANGDGVYSAGSDYVFAFENPVQANLEAFPFLI